MNLKKICFQPQNRRGLSSVVGALFFTVLMIAGFSVLSLALDAQTDIVTTQRIVSDIEIKKQQEQFGVLAYNYGTNLLNVTINNHGQNPVEISSIWITNKTLPDQPTTRWNVNYADAFVPSGFANNVLSTQTLQIVPDTYDIKVISSLGTIETIEFALGAAGSSGLRAEMITDPPDVIIGQNVTVVMVVTNTGEELIQNVEPDAPLIPSGSGSVLASSSHSPLSVDLDRGESVMFSWDFQVDGISGDDLIFSSIARGDLNGIDDVYTSSVSDVSILREPTDGGNGAFGGPSETTGNVIMEFTSFEFCEPAVDDCRSNSSDWITAWDGKQSTEYIWRINIANIGAEDILLEETTSLFTLHAQTQGGGNLPRTFFIKADSTPTNEDPGAYIDYSKIILKDGTPVLVYFGVDDNGSSVLQATRNSPGINAVFLLIFGHQDLDGSGTFNAGDIPYSQNLAYQGLRLY